MTSTVSNAVATRDNGPLARIAQYQGEYAAILPSHIKAETWIRVAQGALRRNPQLLEAATKNISSLMSALHEAARLGLEPGTEQYYLTPRKVKGQLEILGITGYQGEIELIYRAGAVSSVIVEVVRQKDIFRYSPGRDDRPHHEIDWDLEDRGPLKLAYAYGVMKDGATSKVVVLNKAHIAAAKASSQGSDSEYSPWKRHEEAMWLKTAAHRLAKWVPTSAEYIREQLRAVRDVAAEPIGTSSTPMPVPAAAAPAGQPPVADDGVLDGEVVPDGVDPETGEIEWPETRQPGGGA